MYEHCSDFELLQTFGIKEMQPLSEAVERATGAAYRKLQAALEIHRRRLREPLERGNVMTRPGDTRKFLVAHLRDHQHEVFTVLFLDTRHRLISCENMFHGTIDGASVPPREVVKRALAVNAAAVILAHNHPSRVAEPSSADRAITRRLVDALGLVDVRLLDHFVVGGEEATSFAERGWL